MIYAGLSFKLDKFDREGFLKISCIYPIEIHGELKIYDTNIEILFENNRFVMKEETGKLIVYCSKIEIKEYLAVNYSLYIFYRNLLIFSFKK